MSIMELIGVITGRPGSGKTSCTSVAIDKYPSISLDVSLISAGDTLRDIVGDRRNSMYKDIIVQHSEELSMARPLPQDLVGSIMEERLSNIDQRLILLDGYPRFLNQISRFKDIAQSLGRRVVGILDFEVADSISTERLLSRGSRSEEVSYTEQVISQRLDEYHDHVAPTINNLRESYNYHYIDASTSQHKVIEAARRAIELMLDS